MKILFILVSIKSLSKPSFHPGIASIAATLKKNKHKVDLFHFGEFTDIETLFLRIRTFKSKIIAFSLINANYKQIIKISKIIKKEFPNIIIIYGGVHVVLNPEIIYKYSCIDAICLGEGEEALLDLINKIEKRIDYSKTKGFWIRKAKKIFINDRREIANNLDALPFPEREIFIKEGLLKFNLNSFENEKKIGLEFIFSRGCPFDCTYCVNHALKNYYGNNYFRLRGVNNAISEIKLAIQRYRYDYFQFLDDTFTLEKDWLREFLKQYKKIKVPFYCNARVNTCSKETYFALKEAGCKGVSIGVESGNEYLRRNILNRQMSNKEIIDNFRWAKEAGLKTHAFFMFGLPEETPQTFLESIELLSKIKPTSYSFFVFIPYKGTKLYDYCRERGYLLKNIKDKKYYLDNNIKLDMPKFKAKDILYYKYHYNFLIYLKTNKKSKLLNIYDKLVFSLISKPPSNKLFYFYRLILKIIRLFILQYKLFYKTLYNNPPNLYDLQIIDKFKID